MIDDKLIVISQLIMNKFFKLATITLSGAFSVASLTFSPAVKAQDNQFDVCLRELTTSGVSVENAQVGCADALVPRELSTCVRNITQFTSISAKDALTSCYQVRRPMDLGNCVVNINNTILVASSKNNETKAEDDNKPEMGNNQSPLMMALSTCQASLLPVRHSECVIGLSRTPEASNPVKAMETCLSAEDFPRDLFPSYQ